MSAFWKELQALLTGAVRRPVETCERIRRVSGKVAVAPTARAGLAFVGVLAAVAGASVAWPQAASGAVAALLGFLWVALGLVLGVFLAATVTIWGVARALGTRAPFGDFLAAWAMSYVPTATWFAGLLLWHALFARPGLVDLGGPRSPAFVALMVVFLAFSVAVLAWKLLLLYLTLRVVGGLDFRRIVVAALVLGPVAAGYWALGFYLEWFKVPLI